MGPGPAISAVGNWHRHQHHWSSMAPVSHHPGSGDWHSSRPLAQDAQGKFRGLCHGHALPSGWKQRFHSLSGRDYECDLWTDWPWAKPWKRPWLPHFVGLRLTRGPPAVQMDLCSTVCALFIKILIWPLHGEWTFEIGVQNVFNSISTTKKRTQRHLEEGFFYCDESVRDHTAVK